MEFFLKYFFFTTANIAALLFAAYFDKYFIIISDVSHIVPLAALLSLLNLTIRPLLKLLFSPLIGITLGYFNIIINAGILYFLDIYSNSLTINGLWALIIGAHLVGLIVTLIDYAGAIIYGTGEI